MQLVCMDAEKKLCAGERELFRSKCLLESAFFQDESRKIAIISEASSTGISLHSNITDHKKPSKRLHCIPEPPWTALGFTQQLGRTNRSNQAHKPEYMILMSEVPGERRFASTLAGRMSSMVNSCLRLMQ